MIYQIDSPGANGLRPKAFASDRKRSSPRDGIGTPIVVTADRAVFHFSNVDDFSFAVDSRTAVSPSLFQAIVDASIDETVTPMTIGYVLYGSIALSFLVWARGGETAPAPAAATAQPS